MPSATAASPPGRHRFGTDRQSQDDDDERGQGFMQHDQAGREIAGSQDGAAEGQDETQRRADQEEPQVA
jgi:hypothetical protein